jgi:hypothetical protein
MTAARALGQIPDRKVRDYHQISPTEPTSLRSSPANLIWPTVSENPGWDSVGDDGTSGLSAEGKVERDAGSWLLRDAP